MQCNILVSYRLMAQCSLRNNLSHLLVNIYIFLSHLLGSAWSSTIGPRRSPSTFLQSWKGRPTESKSSHKVWRWTKKVFITVLRDPFACSFAVSAHWDYKVHRRFVFFIIKRIFLVAKFYTCLTFYRFMESEIKLDESIKVIHEYVLKYLYVQILLLHISNVRFFAYFQIGHTATIIWRFYWYEWIGDVNVIDNSW